MDIIKSRFDQAAKSMKEAAPEPNELLKWFRNTVQSYAVFIPGAKSFVDSVFNDLDAIEQKHREEVNDIISKAYSELREATQGGLTIETAQKTWKILEKYLNQLGDLASNSMLDILDNHPQLKEKVAGSIDQLKSMANSYGPEAKKELDQTYSQIEEILSEGVGIDTADKIEKIIQKKVERLEKMGDEAWKKGMEQAKPYLDQNPQVKEIIEKNADVLKQGNISELYEKLKDGNTDSIQEYVKQATEKAKGGMGQNLEQYKRMMTGDDKIIPNLTELQKAARKHGDEAEKILRETYEEIADTLSRKKKDVEKLAEKASRGAK
jgi:regulator of RNase E activity RraB